MRAGTKNAVLSKAEHNQASVERELRMIHLVASGAVLVTETEDAWRVWWHEEMLPIDPLQRW